MSDLYTKDAVPKSEPSEAGPIWRRKKDSTVDVLPLAAAHDLAVFF